MPFTIFTGSAFLFIFRHLFCHVVFAVLSMDPLWTVLNVLTATFVEGEKSVLDGRAFQQRVCTSTDFDGRECQRYFTATS